MTFSPIPWAQKTVKISITSYKVGSSSPSTCV